MAVVEHGGSPGIAQTVVGFGNLFQERFQVTLAEESRTKLDTLFKAVVTSHFRQVDCEREEEAENAVFAPGGEISKLSSPVTAVVADVLQKMSSRPSSEVQRAVLAAVQEKHRHRAAHPKVAIVLEDDKSGCWRYAPGTTSAVANGVTRFSLTVKVAAQAAATGGDVEMRVKYAGVVWQDGETPTYDAEGWPTGAKTGDPVVAHQENCPTRNCANDWVTGQVHMLVKLKLKFSGNVSPGGFLASMTAGVELETQLNLSMPFKHLFNTSEPITGQPGFQPAPAPGQ